MPKVVGHPGPPQSPSITEVRDLAGKIVRLTMNFDETTLKVTSVVVFRDVGCTYTQAVFGVGPDGIPDSSTQRINIPSGTTTITQAQLNANGIDLLTDIPQYLFL